MDPSVTKTSEILKRLKENEEYNMNYVEFDFEEFFKAETNTIDKCRAAFAKLREGDSRYVKHLVKERPRSYPSNLDWRTMKSTKFKLSKLGLNKRDLDSKKLPKEQKRLIDALDNPKIDCKSGAQHLTRRSKVDNSAIEEEEETQTIAFFEDKGIDYYTLLKDYSTMPTIVNQVENRNIKSKQLSQSSARMGLSLHKKHRTTTQLTSEYSNLKSNLDKLRSLEDYKAHYGVENDSFQSN